MGEKEEEGKLEGLEEEETEAEAEPPGAGSRARPSLTPSVEPGGRRESWLWSLLPLPLLSGLSWLGDRSKPFQEPLCCELDRSSTSTSGMCPECEITFCKKCEKLHYSPVFIEHGLLGHAPRHPAEDLNPTPSAGKGQRGLGPWSCKGSKYSSYRCCTGDAVDLVVAPKTTEEKEKDP